MNGNKPYSTDSIEAPTGYVVANVQMKRGLDRKPGDFSNLGSRPDSIPAQAPQDYSTGVPPVIQTPNIQIQSHAAVPSQSIEGPSKINVWTSHNGTRYWTQNGEVTDFDPNKYNIAGKLIDNTNFASAKQNAGSGVFNWGGHYWYGQTYQNSSPANNTTSSTTTRRIVRRPVQKPVQRNTTQTPRPLAYNNIPASIRKPGTVQKQELPDTRWKKYAPKPVKAIKKPVQNKKYTKPIMPWYAASSITGTLTI